MATKVPFEFTADQAGVNQALSNIEGKLNHLASHVGLGVGVGEALEHGFEKALELIKVGIEKTAEFLKESFEEATAAIRVDTVLETSIRNAGKAATFTAGEIEKLAHVWQDKTIFDHKQIEQAATSFINLGIAGDNLLDAIKTSQDLATALNEDLTPAAETLGKAMANPERAVMLLRRAHLLGEESARKLADALDKATDSAGAQRAILDTLNGVYHDQAARLAEAAGGVDQLKHQWSDVKEEVGRQLIPIIHDLLPAFKYELGLIGEAINHMVEAVVGWSASWDTSMAGAQTASEKFVASLAVMENKIDRTVMRAKELYYSLAVLNEQTPQRWFDGDRMTPNERALANVQEKLANPESNDDIAKRAIDDLRSSIAKTAEEQKKFMDSIKGRPSDTSGPRPWEPSKDLLKLIDKAVDDSLKPAKEDKPFRSSVETGQSIFSRIQAAAASEKPIEKRMLTAQERLVQILEEDKRKRDLTNQLLQQIRDKQIPQAITP